jgi:hypothetical protein
MTNHGHVSATPDLAVSGKDMPPAPSLLNDEARICSEGLIVRSRREILTS